MEKSWNTSSNSPREKGLDISSSDYSEEKARKYSKRHGYLSVAAVLWIVALLPAMLSLMSSDHYVLGTVVLFIQFIGFVGLLALADAQWKKFCDEIEKVRPDLAEKARNFGR